jgi:hypothetical protein
MPWMDWQENDERWPDARASLTNVCQHLDLRDVVRASEACKRLRHGDGALETVDLPTKSPVVTALRELPFPRPELVPRTRPTGCYESWVAYLARGARQRRCREAPPIATGYRCSLFVEAAGRLLACGCGSPVGYGNVYFNPSPMAAMAGVRVRSVVIGDHCSLALGWDGRVYSWGDNESGQGPYRRLGPLGHGDRQQRLTLMLVKGLQSVCGIAAGALGTVSP